LSSGFDPNPTDTSGRYPASNREELAQPMIRASPCVLSR
jgi:hypothetical protein